MATDIYAPDVTASAESAVAVTPSDTTDLGITRGLYVGVAGDVVVTMWKGSSAVTFSGVLGGTVLPIRVSKVMAATSATGIVALY